jgi:hypothetical protein
LGKRLSFDMQRKPMGSLIVLKYFQKPSPEAVFGWAAHSSWKYWFHLLSEYLSIVLTNDFVVENVNPLLPHL